MKPIAESGDAATLRYMPQLDALRAFAVLGVMLSHYLILDHVVALGRIGVKLFFTLSGYLITLILLRCRERVDARSTTPGDELRVFYGRRFLRLFPALALTLALAVACNVESVRTTWPWHASYLSNVYFARRGSWEGPLSPLWSLAVEEQFYLVWPLVVLLAPLRRVVPAIWAAIGIAIVYRMGAVIYHLNPVTELVLPFACVDALGIGALLAVAQERADMSPVSVQQIRWVGRWVGLPLFVCLTVAHALGLAEAGYRVLVDLGGALLFAWLVAEAAAGIPGRIGRLLRARPVLYLGTISYGLYLYHNFVPGILRAALGDPLQVMRNVTRPLGPRAGTALLLVAHIGVAILLAAVAWLVYERPMLTLRRYIGSAHRTAGEVSPVQRGARHA